MTFISSLSPLRLMRRLTRPSRTWRRGRKRIWVDGEIGSSKPSSTGPRRDNRAGVECRLELLGISDVRRIIGVRPVESSSSRLVIAGPGSEKRTLFLDFDFRPGVEEEEAEKSPGAAVSRLTSVCCVCSPTPLLRVRRKARGSCDSSDILLCRQKSKPNKTSKQNVGSSTLFIEMYNRDAAFTQQTIPGRGRCHPHQNALQCLFISALGKWGAVSTRPPWRCTDSTLEIQSFRANRDSSKPPSRHPNAASFRLFFCR